MTSLPSPSRQNEAAAAATASDDSSSVSISLAVLRGLRCAPSLSGPQRLKLRQELAQAIAPYSWFTLGVMAPNAETAMAVLRQIEAALGWPALQPDRQDSNPLFDRADQPGEDEEEQASPEDGHGPDGQPPAASAAVSDPVKPESPDPPSLPVFLKGNQRTGLFQLRAEAGLGVGLLITGQEAAEPIASETWGPLPLDLFA